MGSWGVGNYENDDALDWLGSLCESGGDIHKAIEAVRTIAELKPDDYLESVDACDCLAAAECIAAATGKIMSQPPDGLKEWIKSNPGRPKDEDIGHALQAVRRIKKASELRDLWEESTDFNAWLSVVEELESRLQ